MYVILVYDFGEKRVSKMLRLCRRYLNWIQNSVFEGEISKAQLAKMKNELGPYINDELDSVIIFKSRQEKWLDKEFLGKVEDKTGFLL